MVLGVIYVAIDGIYSGLAVVECWEWLIGTEPHSLHLLDFEYLRRSKHPDALSLESSFYGATKVVGVSELDNQ